MSGIITSGFTLIPRFVQSAAASKIARTCISTISGIEMLSRTPRKPIIGSDLVQAFTAASRSSFSFQPSGLVLHAHRDHFFEKFFLVWHELV
ncbi:MAG: hypothetical protein U0V48_14905 [Anaerolineales bacterium]